ncbi:hypothetical protein TNCV_3845121 [Trichonephila clavipes]|nr:hypothetical protein TNCV_3845121 [Trichonephila clavipes]
MCVAVHKNEIWSRLFTEESDIGCKDFDPRPLTCQSSSIKYMKVGIPVCNDACPNHQTTSTIVILFDDVRRSIPTSGFSSHENTSRVPAPNHHFFKTGVFGNMLNDLFCGLQSKEYRLQGT